MHELLNRGRSFVFVGRVLGLLATLALLGAWLAQPSASALLGLDQPQLFNEARARALLSLACLCSMGCCIRTVCRDLASRFPESGGVGASDSR